MLNPAVKLNSKFFDPDVEQKPTRDGYGDGLVFAGEHDPNVVVLCADLTESTRSEKFAKKFPERFFEMGVAEQNLAAVAAGLGISGKIPFISSYAAFSPGRNWEQIRTTIAYNDSNVKIAGSHAGVSVGPDGATHQMTEDIAIMRVMPNMKVFVPCDAIEARKATVAAAKIWGPCYIRFAREKSPLITTEETPFTPGRIQIFWEAAALRQAPASAPLGGASVGKQGKPEAALIACGPALANALMAAQELAKEKIQTMVVNCHTIKPLDEEGILETVRRCGAVVTVEEHQIAGGLGGAVAELLAKKNPVPIEFIGLHDTYGESGPPAELIEKYGMGIGAIKEAVKKVIGRVEGR